MPSAGGASTTPDGRVGFLVGGAARIPTGALDAPTSPSAAALDQNESGGVVPRADARLGVAPHWDVGLSAVGATVRGDVRAEVVLDSRSSLRPALLLGPMVHGGPAVAEGVDTGGRLGLSLPVLFGLSAASLVELWVGPRLAVEHAWATGEAAGVSQSSHLSGLRAGGIIGLAIGFRHLWALVELTVDWETWSGAVDGVEVSASGVAWTPAFALRLLL